MVLTKRSARNFYGFKLIFWTL